jgi:hypothetical protein
MYSRAGEIIGKYCVEYKCKYHTVIDRIYTDNALEAAWEANKKNGTIVNICGEREFYKEDGKYKVRKP